MLNIILFAELKDMEKSPKKTLKGKKGSTAKKSL